MSTALTVKSNGNGAMVPFDPSRLGAALKQTARDGGGGVANFLKMEKTGDWVFGTDATEVGPEEVFYVDPRAFMHGHIAWDRGNVGTKLGEEMSLVTEPIPPVGETPPGADGWQFQLGMGLVSADAGTAMIYRATSVGGKRAIGTLAQQIAARINEPDCVPIVTLSSSPYDHRKYGRIYNPVIEIEGWATMAELEDAASGEQPAAVPPTPTAPKRSTLKIPAAKKTAPVPPPGKAPKAGKVPPAKGKR